MCREQKRYMSSLVVRLFAPLLDAIDSTRALGAQYQQLHARLVGLYQHRLCLVGAGTVAANVHAESGSAAASSQPRPCHPVSLHHIKTTMAFLLIRARQSGQAETLALTSAALTCLAKALCFSSCFPAYAEKQVRVLLFFFIF